MIPMTMMAIIEHGLHEDHPLKMILTMFCFGFFVTCQLNKLTLSLSFQLKFPKFPKRETFWQLPTSSKKVGIIFPTDEITARKHS